MTIAVEYLVVMPKNDSFCDSTETFNRLLEVDSSISIRDGKIYFKGQTCYKYEITGDEVTGKEQRYFQLRFSSDQNSGSLPPDIEDFTVFLKCIRGIIARLGGQVETLWDDISFYYSKCAYPIIYEVENLMRKLITNFMIITIGKDWVAETSPNEVQEVINRSRRKDYVNVLHTIDFIDLASFLVKPYSRRSTQELFDALKKAKSIDDYNSLSNFIPKSNWQRYFSALVDCEDTYLSKRWTDLYDLRCKVAHNAIMAKSDFERILELSNDLKSKLLDALNKLPQVRVPKSERETVAENAVTAIGGAVGEFISAWQVIEQMLVKTLQRKGFNARYARQVALKLKEINYISEEMVDTIILLNKVRNELVHMSVISYSEDELHQYIREAHRLIKMLGEKDEVDELFPD